MKTIVFKSIRTRLTYWFLMLTLLPLLIILVVTYFQRVDAIKVQTFEKLTAIRDLKVERLQAWLSEITGDMYTISSDNELTDLEYLIDKTSYNQNDNKVLEKCRRIVNRYLENYPTYSEIFIINPTTGKIIVSTNTHWEGDDKSTNEYFTKPMNSRKISFKDIYYSATMQSNEMAYSIPVFCSQHDNEHIVGILVARIDLQNSLYEMLLDRVGLGETGETLIVNKDVVALNELRWYENAPLNLRISAEPAINAINGETGVMESTDYRNEKILAAYTHIPETGWGFICKQDLYELNAPIRQMIYNFLIIFFISGIFITLIALRVSKSISRPILEMNGVAQKFGSGDFSIRNKYSSKDELGSLSTEINNMADLTESRNIIQTGVVDIAKNIIGKTSMLDFGNALLLKMMEITGANMSTFYILNELTSEYEHFTSIGANKDLLKSFSSQHPEGEFGNAVSKQEIFYLKDISEDTIFKFVTTAGEIIPKEIITIPIMTDNIVVALISLISNTKFTTESYSTIEQSWIAINSIYTNLMTNERTRILSEHLSRTNQKLEAQTEELQEQTEELQAQSEELQSQTEELQEQNLELDMQRMQVEEANRLKSEFLSNMSHELRTPLNSIMALSRVLIMQAKDKLTEEENNYLEIVERNGKQLLTLINDILDLSKIEAGKMDVYPKTISLKTLLIDITDSLMPLVNEKKLELNLNIAADLPEIETDEAKLYQVITNIISNAVKFTETGKVDVVVNFDSKHAIIEVIDTGIGIPQETLPHIFEEFRQVDGSSSRQYEGTGLGLAIAYKLIKILGGDIRAASQLGEGSVFTISLPLKWNNQSDLLEIPTISKAITKSDKKLILVVDDDPYFVNLISTYLQESGYNTVGAASGAEAIRMAEEHLPFAITLDVIMPEMDGWEVLQHLKKNNKTRNIPVIIASVSEDKDTGFAMGAIGYIQKPVDKHLLITEINKLHKNPDTVLIVDDNEMELKQMAMFVKAANINPLTAFNGKECLEILQDRIPDVLVLDLVMPEMNGFQVLDKIRKRKDTQDLPVIIVTAKDLTKEDKSKLQGQVSSILAKSENTPQAVLMEIKRILTELEKLQKKFSSPKNRSETKLLIVEDNESTIAQVRAVLEKENFNVDVAAGGKEALEYIKHTIPDGIILDLMMPEIDGFEVLEKIRNTDLTSNIPVLILTAKDLTKEDLSKLSANNIQQLVQKGDIDIPGLLSKVNLMLDNKIIFKQKTNEMKVKTNINGHKNIPGLSRILIVEDNPDNMVTIKAIISNDYKILEAVDGEQGLYKIVNEKPDLVLLDISLPKMDGTEILSIIRDADEIRDIPVIAVTARAMKEDKETLLADGFDDYISKPIDQELLLKAIKKQLGK